MGCLPVELMARHAGRQERRHPGWRPLMGSPEHRSSPRGARARIEFASEVRLQYARTNAAFCLRQKGFFVTVQVVRSQKSEYRIEPQHNALLTSSVCARQAGGVECIRFIALIRIWSLLLSVTCVSQLLNSDFCLLNSWMAERLRFTLGGVSGFRRNLNGAV